MHCWPGKLILPGATFYKPSFWLIQPCGYNNNAFKKSESKSVCTRHECARQSGSAMLAHTGTSFSWVTLWAGSYRLRGGACWQWCSWQHWKRHTPTPHGPLCWEIWTVSCLLVGRCACPCWASLPLPEREIKKERQREKKNAREKSEEEEQEEKRRGRAVSTHWMRYNVILTDEH